MKIKFGLLLIIIIIVFLFPFNTMAQKKSFTLDDLIPGGKTYKVMQPQNIHTEWWGDQLVCVEKEQCKRFKGNQVCETLFTLKECNTALKNSGIKAATTLQGITFPYTESTLALIKTSQQLVLYDWKMAKVEWKLGLPKNISNEDWNSVSRAYAFNENENLFVITADGKKHQVSTDGSHDIVYGQSVHRNEFGIKKGTYWSTDGSLLCFYRMDQSMVPDYPLVDISTRIATVAPTKYPMAGEVSHKVSVGVFNPVTDKTIWLNTGDNTDQYYCDIAWTPDNKHIILYNLNRDQNHAQLLQFDALTGQLEKQLMEESHPKYVEPQHEVTFLPWDSDKFIYWSRKENFDQLYLYSLKEGRTIRKITTEPLGVIIDMLGFNVKNKQIIVSSTGCSSIQHNLFAVNVEKDGFVCLDNGKGYHNGKVSTSGTYIVDSWSTPTDVRCIDLINTKNKKSERLLTANNPWENFNMPQINCGTLKAADGKTDLYYRLILPSNFNANEKYPAVVYVYGGPHTRLVNASFGYGYRGWEIYMAQLGYVVFVLDNRGSSERGLEFENVTFRQLGTEEIKDQMCGVNFLKSQTYIDENRLGVHGWSYGGFMTTNLMLTHPDVFKCAVAGGPVINWEYYEIMYGERYMDTPQSNPEGYKNNNLCLRAGNLKGRLLIIFGYNDPVCVPQHTLSFIRACETAGTHPDLLTYPGDEHNMQGADQIHLYEHITRYFEDFLKPIK